ncbi:MAG TPA: hypothetical protein PLI74_08220 [Candidatus Kapabacteria bacterium]|nr:hypothetical protein [Candidatus Kapabacteria bacterium]
METNTASPFPYVRDFGQIISVTIEFIRHHFSSLYKLLFIFIAPLAAIAGIFTSYAMTDYFSWIQEIAENPDAGKIWSFFTMMLFSYGLLIVATVFCMIFTIEYCILTHKQGIEHFNVRQFIVRCLRSAPRYILLGIVSALLNALAYLFFIVPGIYFSIVILIMFPIMANEQLGVWETIKRGTTLIQGHWWNTLGLALVVYIAVAVIIGVFSLPMYLGMGLNAFFSLDSSNEVPSYITILSIFFTMISVVAQVILNSVYHIVFTFKYFSLVEIKEGSSLFTAINQIGSSHDSSMPEETY